MNFINNKEIKDLLKEKNSLWNILFEQAQDGIVILDQNGKVIVHNKKFADILCYNEKELESMYVWDWDTMYSKKDLLNMIHEINELGHNFETRHIRKDGKLIDVELSNSSIIFEFKKIICCICRDITKRKINEHEIYIRATTDALIGLYNRSEFIANLDRQIIAARRYGSSFSVIMYDIDDFKFINDQFGHPEGDNILKSSSELIKNNIRENDIFARWGGEEFILLLPHSNLPISVKFAERLRNLISNYNFGIGIPVTASFGVTDVLLQDNLCSLLKRVDNALYNAKRNGKNRIEFL